MQFEQIKTWRNNTKFKNSLKRIKEHHSHKEIKNKNFNQIIKFYYPNNFTPKEFNSTEVNFKKILIIWFILDRDRFLKKQKQDVYPQLNEIETFLKNASEFSIFEFKLVKNITKPPKYQYKNDNKTLQNIFNEYEKSKEPELELKIKKSKNLKNLSDKNIYINADKLFKDLCNKPEDSRHAKKQTSLTNEDVYKFLSFLKDIILKLRETLYEEISTHKKVVK